MRFVSYAQEFEDFFIWLLLRDYVKVGNYIDVGANDPIEFSVTKAFYDMGWSGINIEPLPDMCALLEAERPRDVNLCLGVGEKEGWLNLRVAGMRSSFAQDVTEKMNGGEIIRKTILPLQMIYDRYCSSDTEIHFCKIDVEGFEREVLLGIDFRILRPWVMVVEATEPGTVIPCHEKWESILLSNGYEFAFANGINRYYVAQEKSFLKGEYNKLGSFIKENTIVKNQMRQVRFE